MLVVVVVVVGVQGGTQQVGSWPRYRFGLRKNQKNSYPQTQKVTVNWRLKGWLEYGTARTALKAHKFDSNSNSLKRSERDAEESESSFRSNLLYCEPEEYSNSIGKQQGSRPHKVWQKPFSKN